ncbi:hypothetical protein CC_2471 [Caulobacter vibrioides CB15]|uniref:Uncharacterized protein n=1 Tax=Caulobacter vibrioides (strain ATCC 19089 / CIP 103742 / CB 15) TaxID=190650 RepID=Q9A5H6_CAUVC|nr:hypothetical protein CC_2471 [Caulobacter vibrioides CB15]
MGGKASFGRGDGRDEVGVERHVDSVRFLSLRKSREGQCKSSGGLCFLSLDGEGGRGKGGGILRPFPSRLKQRRQLSIDIARRGQYALGLQAFGPSFIAGFGEARGGVRRQREAQRDAAALERLGGGELALARPGGEGLALTGDDVGQVADRRLQGGQDSRRGRIGPQRRTQAVRVVPPHFGREGDAEDRRRAVLADPVGGLQPVGAGLGLGFFAFAADDLDPLLQGLAGFALQIGANRGEPFLLLLGQALGLAVHGLRAPWRLLPPFRTGRRS